LTILRKKKTAFRYDKISPFWVLEKSPNYQHGQGNSWKFSKKSPHFEEESYEIPNISGGFGQSSGFLLLKLAYLASYSF
jgi:hypothetical protein